MKEKLKAALAAIQFEPQAQVRKSGDFFVATVNSRGKTLRGVANTRTEAIRRALIGVGK